MNPTINLISAKHLERGKEGRGGERGGRGREERE